MNSKHLVDPELLPLLDHLPPDTTAKTLPLMREIMEALRTTAPDVPHVAVEERFITSEEGEDVRILVYSPTTSQIKGALLWIHGGGFVMGTPEMTEAQSRYLAYTSGCVVVAVDYRKAPESPFPAGFSDCFAALQWMHDTAQSFGVPQDRIAIAGESCGGCLAAGVALKARDEGSLFLSAQFLLYPMLDDRTEAEQMPYSGDFVWTRVSNGFAWDSLLENGAGNADVPVYAAPGRAVTLSGLPPTFISVGALDLLVSEDLLFAKRLIRDGVPTELHVYPGAFHAFTSFDDQSAVSLRSRRDLWDAIIRHFA